MNVLTITMRTHLLLEKIISRTKNKSYIF